MLIQNLNRCVCWGEILLLSSLNMLQPSLREAPLLNYNKVHPLNINVTFIYKCSQVMECVAIMALIPPDTRQSLVYKYEKMFVLPARCSNIHTETLPSFLLWYEGSFKYTCQQLMGEPDAASGPILMSMFQMINMMWIQSFLLVDFVV